MAMTQKIALKGTQGLIERVTDGLPNEAYNMLLNRVQNEQNALTICKYIIAMIHEINPSDGHREGMILLLGRFSIFFNNEKEFKEITRDDLLSYLQHIRKPESSDPKHKWIGTYNMYLEHLFKFFKWLYYPEIEPTQRQRPAIFNNIKELKRKEISCYSPDDLWVGKDILLFLKYCPSSRSKCYHMMAWDTACRPHELLTLRSRDITFKETPDGKKYAQVSIRTGKTGTKSNPLIDSIPYVKDWWQQHPQSSRPDSVFLCGIEKSIGNAISTTSLGKIYTYYKRIYFPKLLNRTDIPEEDKEAIRHLLLKPWNPYVIRHSALTQKAKILKESSLRQYAGWSTMSNMVQKYIHFFNTESSNEILQAEGILPKDKETNVLKSKYCPDCKEPNKPDAKFCVGCELVLTYDAYTEEKSEEVENLKADFESKLDALREEYKLKK